MLVGRGVEQRAIDRLVAAARLGTSGVLALAGEAGVGKTALLDHTIGTLATMRVLRATGLESEGGIPFATLLQLVRPALGELDGIPPIQADALATALALPRPGAATQPHDRFTIGAALLSLICRYAEAGPVAIVVDDLHAADAASANALVFAARRLAADPVLVLFGVRSPDGDRLIRGIPSLTVRGLDLDAARTLLAGTAPGPAHEEHVRLLHRATEGNPLALLELGAADREVIRSLETDLPLRVPRALVEAFGRRVSRLDAECRAALLVAAVCGTDLRLVGDACAVLGTDVRLLGAAQDRELVTVTAGRVEFRHPLLRAAVYSSASTQERHAAHRAAAEATPATSTDRRAWHLAEATWQPDAEVAGLLAAAGEEAVARAAFSAAAAAFERSARLEPDAGRRDAILLRAADAAWTSGDGERATALLDQRPGGDSPASGRDARDVHAIELRASIAARTGSLREALGILIDAADRADTPDGATIALADAVHATFYLGDARTAARLADRLAALRPLVAGSRARALGLMATGMARTLAGSGGADDIRAAVPLLEADPGLRHDPRRLSWLLLAPLFLRDSTGGARLRVLVEEVRGAAGIGALPAVLFHVARDQATTQEWTRAEANYTEAIRLATETGQTTELAMSLAGLAWLDSRSGRADACRAHGADARALCRARDIQVGEVWVGHALGDLELSLGHAVRAAELLSELTALLDELGLDDADLSATPELVDALVRLGRRAEALTLAEEYRRRAEAKGQPWARARADRAMGLARSSGDYDDWFLSALRWHEQTLDDFETARTRLAFGSVLRRDGRRVDAREQLRAALAHFSELGATVWRDHAAAELTATGEHVRRAQVSAVASLTPQELQVSLLLADGSTTRQAAAALFLSPKTVEYHLRKVYTKLGIGSRADLARLLVPDIVPPQG